jgi:hypothetical protein
MDYQVSFRVGLSCGCAAASRHRRSARFYAHFSLLRTLEGGFELPCLNHACDAGTAAMTDLFGER